MSATSANIIPLPVASAEPAAAPAPATAAAEPVAADSAPAYQPVPRWRQHLAAFARTVIPPLLTIALLLLVWQLLCARPGASLPAPSKVLEDTWQLISDPFFDNGGTDKGLFWMTDDLIQETITSLGSIGIKCDKSMFTNELLG